MAVTPLGERHETSRDESNKEGGLSVELRERGQKSLLNRTGTNKFAPVGHSVQYV